MGDVHAPGSPTIRRIRAGRLLKAARERAGLTVETAARRLDTTVRTVRRWEAGQVGIPDDRLADALRLYCPPADEWQEIETLAREGGQSGWWVKRADVVRPSYARFVDLELEASRLVEYSAMLVPGLLQTEEYTRAVMAGHLPPMAKELVRARVALRMQRQAEMMQRAYPLHYVLDEAVLHRCLGRPHMMAAQLRHLLTMARTERILLQVLPFENGEHASIMGTFAVLTVPELGEIAVEETRSGDVYADGTDAAQYTQIFRALTKGALPEPESLEMITEVEGRFRVHGTR
jgi:transcriptional regulator with XRE-family HTH domain